MTKRKRFQIIIFGVLQAYIRINYESVKINIFLIAIELISLKCSERQYDISNSKKKKKTSSNARLKPPK